MDDERTDEGYIDMVDQYEGVDYDVYDYEPESIEYSDCEEDDVAAGAAMAA